MKHRKAKRKLCPFRKVVELDSGMAPGRLTKRERFQPCVGHKCMAYVYTLPFIAEGAGSNPDNWGCARLLKGGADDGA